MSLATRCTACGTIFRVVQDQLRVSEGWVRCGRCAEVFDAREQLFDIDREAPPPWPAMPAATALLPPELEAPAPRAPVWTSAPTPVSMPSAPAPFNPPVHAPRPAPEPAPVAAKEPEPAALEDSRFEPRWIPEEPLAPATQLPPEPAISPADFGVDTVLAPGLAAEAAKLAVAAPAAKAAKAGDAPATTSPMPMPEFMRRAQLSERWRKPQVRAALGLCAVLLVGLLGIQVLQQFHNAIVSVYPQARPLVQAYCEAAGCTLQAWQRIDAVSVEASALNQAGPNNQYQLSLNLRNKMGFEVGTPWVELSLTDAGGGVVSRRVLAPTQFTAGKASMAPASEMPLQLLVSTGDLRVSGYTVEIFYP